jgi:hypothetical protein
MPDRRRDLVDGQVVVEVVRRWRQTASTVRQARVDDDLVGLQRLQAR